VVLDIPLNIFPPNDQVIFVRFEELCDVIRPCLNATESLALENTGQVSMHGSNGSSSKLVMEDTECCDRLPIKSEF